MRGKSSCWEPVACIASARALLVFLHQTIASHLASTSPADPTRSRVFRVTFSPKAGPHGGDAGITVRSLDHSELEREVVAGKKHEERVGFLLKRWVDGVEARRERNLGGTRQVDLLFAVETSAQGLTRIGCFLRTSTNSSSAEPTSRAASYEPPVELPAEVLQDFEPAATSAVLTGLRR